MIIYTFILVAYSFSCAYQVPDPIKLTSINEVVKIHEEGSKKRVEAQEELAKIEDELKQALLDVGSR